MNDDDFQGVKCSSRMMMRGPHSSLKLWVRIVAEGWEGIVQNSETSRIHIAVAGLTKRSVPNGDRLVVGAQESYHDPES